MTHLDNPASGKLDINMAVVGEKKRLSLKRSRGSDIQQDKEIKMEPRTKEEEDDAMMLPHCRLINLGNTCYLNAVVQCLKFSPRFKDMLDEAVLQVIIISFDFVICQFNDRMNIYYKNLHK